VAYADHTMKGSDVNVLLLGEDAKSWSYLRQRLEKLSCRCWLAESPEQFATLLETHVFHLVLSTCRAHRASRIARLLDRVSCSVFCCYPVKDSCWWLPLVGQQHKSVGAPALRPSEFATEVDRVIGETMLHNMAAAAFEPPKSSSQFPRGETGDWSCRC
jgi:hypothetical protein